MLNTGTACISDVIGQDNTSVAFVYGAYSLCEKFANGLLLFWLVSTYAEDGHALKWIISVVPTAAAIGCAILTHLGTKHYADKLSMISGNQGLKNMTLKQATATVAPESKDAFGVQDT